MTIGIGWEHEVDEKALAWLDLRAHEIYGVVMRTVRDASGIEYSVTVQVDMGVIGYDDCAQCGSEREIWRRNVRFGNREASRAGGVQFIAAAIDQENCASTMWERLCAAVTP